MTENRYTIGELAKKAKVSTKTILVYEEKGLIHSYRNSENNYRYFDESALIALQRIQMLRYLGFGLDSIKITMNHYENMNVTEVLLAQKHLLEEKTAELERMIFCVNRAIAQSEMDDFQVEELFDVLHTIITSRRADECLKLIKKHIDDPGAWMKWVFDQGNLKEGYKILDAGCGFGNLWRYNENRLPVDLDVTLVDYHNTNADELEKYVADKPQFKFLWGDMNELELGADYQIIFANHVIGYMESPKDTYGKLKSCLAMEGKLITTWAGLNDREQVANLFCSYFPKEERKLQDFLIEKKQTIKDRERVLNEVFDHVELRKYPFVLAVSTKEGMLEHLARWAESMGISPSADLNRLAEELISEKPYEINCDNYLYVCS